jgi:hypothetical protein
MSVNRQQREQTIGQLRERYMQGGGTSANAALEYAKQDESVAWQKSGGVFVSSCMYLVCPSIHLLSVVCCRLLSLVSCLLSLVSCLSGSQCHSTNCAHAYIYTHTHT